MIIHCYNFTIYIFRFYLLKIKTILNSKLLSYLKINDLSPKKYSLSIVFICYITTLIFIIFHFFLFITFHCNRFSTTTRRYVNNSFRLFYFSQLFKVIMNNILLISTKYPIILVNIQGSQ